MRRSRLRESPIRPWAAAALLLAWASASAAAAPGALPAVNLHPAHLVLPQPGAARTDGPGLELRAGYGSVSSQDTGEGAAAILDMEVGRLSLEWSREVGAAVTLGVTVPWIWLTAGAFDGALNDYHEALGLPAGDRVVLPENELEYLVSRRGRIYRPDPPAAGGLGDVEITLSRPLSLGATGRLRTVGRVVVQLPSGAAADGHGNGSIDAAGGAGAQWQGEGVSLFGALDLVYVGGSAHPALHLGTRAVAQALAGGAVRVGRELWLSAQLAWSSSPYDTGIRILDRDVLLLAAGLSGRCKAGLRWTLGFTEDLVTESSPDIAVFLSAAWEGGAGRDEPRAAPRPGEDRRVP